MHDFSKHALDVYWLLVGSTYQDTLLRLLLLNPGLPILAGLVLEFRIIPLSPRQRPTLVLPLGFAIIGLGAFCNMARVSEPSFMTTVWSQLAAGGAAILVSSLMFGSEGDTSVRRHLLSEVSLLHHFVVTPAYLYVFISTAGIVIVDCFKRGLDGRGLDLTVAIVAFVFSTALFAYGLLDEHDRRGYVEQVKFRYRNKRRILFTGLR